MSISTTLNLFRSICSALIYLETSPQKFPQSSVNIPCRVVQSFYHLVSFLFGLRIPIILFSTNKIFLSSSFRSFVHFLTRYCSNLLNRSSNAFISCSVCICKASRSSATDSPLVAKFKHKNIIKRNFW